MQNIYKSFGDKIVFENFNILINQGDFLCIAGNSGTGKSTLLNMMGLLERPDSGTINVFGKQNVKPNSHTAQKLLRHKIGFLFQNFALIDDKSVNYNLDLACVDKKRWDKNSKTQLLEKLQLDVSLNKKVYHLSGGEQQRLALARLIMKDCDFILADEPTGSLDQTNRNTVLDILSQLNHNGKTIVIVSHDPFVMERCQRVVNLNSPSKAEA
ncbi:putative bacteriocin export ABC transporter [Heyndrickxia coagulans]|uniref:putative bacteriocin export ABC transporter n=2 Tax=Bacillaceae TaxID=186817 RepID=UPI001F384955|nr:putative bacteriocin export ABC transporter [Heyndrickxia coagulans]